VHIVALSKTPNTLMRGHIRSIPPRLLLVLMAVWLSLPLDVSAQSETPYDLINAVNELRALHRLQPYTIDPQLMAYAQEHSEYQAAIRTSTHIHSDGMKPLSRGLEENVASGDVGIITVPVVVYEIWSDWGHRNIMIGYADGEIGAGVAITDTRQIYYTVDIRVGEEAVAVATVAPITALQTSMPGQDGSVIHTVGYGQTLWSIAVAYGVKIDDIRRLNSIAADSTTITTGQKLLIRQAGSLSPVPTGESGSTVNPSPIITAASATAAPSATGQSAAALSATAEPTRAPSEASPERNRTGLLVAVGIGILALSIAAIIGFFPAHDDQMTDARK